MAGDGGMLKINRVLFLYNIEENKKKSERGNISIAMIGIKTTYNITREPNEYKEYHVGAEIKRDK